MSKLWMGVIAVVALVLVAKAMGSSRGNAAAAKEKIKAGALVLDVRTPGEYQHAHVEGALNIPLQDLEARLGELKNKNRAIVVYCASGRRSASAAKILTAAGFVDVTNAGGLANLQ